MRQPRVVVVGSANMDLVATAPALPRPGETVLGTDFVMVPGGKGANQAIAATRAGAHCSFVGAIGSDSFGVTLRARITAAGVDTSQLRVTYGTSGVALVMVNAEGENAIVVTPGANASLTTLTEPELALVRDADVLVAQLEIPVETVTEAAVTARAAGTRVVLNAAPAVPLPPELFAAVDLLVVNENEAQAYTGRGREDPYALLDLVPRAVLTLGSEGAWYGDRDGTAVHLPAVPVETVDSTAAGDAFTAALAVAWGEGRDLVDAVRWAGAAGAACVRRLGASVSLPGRAEIDELYPHTP
ncbi:ribokinase [Micromonospora endophytica]|uniref:Ribokinase n=1 Tax=Micromonospora endophytica TaxID=515350 RepID=A0A2W2C3R2_9ACTN|nr:ribokinase [Micromonospora endophytica]PZF92450.1 ribokinase [Micromonospora endophytica]RIW44019.1 ribokinase [Micromonospora endophytica]BCJ58106.1 ribokinase [Micromonospora endophytica]